MQVDIKFENDLKINTFVPLLQHLSWKDFINKSIKLNN